MSPDICNNFMSIISAIKSIYFRHFVMPFAVALYRPVKLKGHCNKTFSGANIYFSAYATLSNTSASLSFIFNSDFVYNANFLFKFNNSPSLSFGLYSQYPPNLLGEKNKQHRSFSASYTKYTIDVLSLHHISMKGKETL